MKTLDTPLFHQFRKQHLRFADMANSLLTSSDLCIPASSSHFCCSDEAWRPSVCCSNLSGMPGRWNTEWLHHPCPSPQTLLTSCQRQGCSVPTQAKHDPACKSTTNWPTPQTEKYFRHTLPIVTLKSRFHLEPLYTSNHLAPPRTIQLPVNRRCNLRFGVSKSERTR